MADPPLASIGEKEEEEIRCFGFIFLTCSMLRCHLFIGGQQMGVFYTNRIVDNLFSGTGNGLYINFSFGFTFSNLNLVTTLCMKVRICTLAYSFPGHNRGPPPIPNGTKVYGAGPLPSNLEGSNFSGSRKYSGFLLVELIVQYV